MPPELPQALAVAFEVIAVLESLGVGYHLGGSYASSLHGFPRPTQDNDMVVALEECHVSELADLLERALQAGN